MLFSGNVADFWAVFRAHLAFYAHIPSATRKRMPTVKSFTALTGTYSGSIVWDYFVRKKKSFMDLKLK
ncbi:MAG: glycosyltransferase family 2 protein, partial [Bacteroidia bacterium]|nr:glycosyltransferase family 2 protein [Bacteroidia bacterium]